jgi:hypothetical protein
LRRKKQRRTRAADLSTSTAPSDNPSPDSRVSFGIEVHDAHSIDLENHPRHEEDMTEIHRSPTPVASITSGSSARIKRVPVPAYLNNPFGDDARVNESFFTEPDPFVDPEHVPPGTRPPLEIQVTTPSRLSSGSTLDRERYSTGELTPKAIEPSRLSAGSTINGKEFSSGELSPKANQPSRLSAGSSVAGQDYTPSVAGTVSRPILLIICL